MSLMICSEGVFAVPDFCLIFAPRLATMSQKSSFPHPTDSVQYVLTSNISEHSPGRPLLGPEVTSHDFGVSALGHFRPMESVLPADPCLLRSDSDRVVALSQNDEMGH